MEVGTARCAVPDRVQRSERTVQCLRSFLFAPRLLRHGGRRSAPSLPTAEFGL